MVSTAMNFNLQTIIWDTIVQVSRLCKYTMIIIKPILFFKHLIPVRNQMRMIKDYRSSLSMCAY